MKARLILLALLLPLAGCGTWRSAPVPVDAGAAIPEAAPQRFAKSGDYDLSIDVGGRTRRFILRVPVRYQRRAPLPVVLAFHEGGGTAEGFKAYAAFDRLADREGFVVVYPDGTGWLGRRLLTWNAGGCCGWAQEQNVDDVGFVRAILRDLADDLPLDATRVYAAGHSNGAMMAYRLAVEMPERIAAIATVGAMMQTDRFPPAIPVPLLHIQSVDDPRVPYEGGTGAPFPFTLTRIAHLPVEPQLARWAAFNGCPAAPRVEDRRTAPVRSGGQDHTATLLVWGPCTSGAEVHLWRLTGAGHGWPGGSSPFPESIMGPDTNVIGAAIEAWRFFGRYRRPAAPPLY